MLQSLQDSDSSVLAPTDIIQRTDIVSAVEHRLFLLIHGVPVEFRSSEPVGARAARARRLARAHS
ncbi:hypothetical protein [Pseudonocardia sp. GCM10023141]|uniref:hypothetical protein n=1 Tax=Pseudonocardia sp. GCM10023141 TaxID=3252653 RepID=UPI0036D33D14